MEILSRPFAPERLLDIKAPALAQGPYGAAAAPPDFGPAYAVDLSGKSRRTPLDTDKKLAAGQADELAKADGTECQTCKSRKYQDGSNESNVSFKTPGHIAPENSAAMVAAHEQEHVNNAVNEGKEKNKKLLSSSVRTYTAICPECGRTYTAGGETKTVMRTTTENKKPRPDALGQNVDIAA